ncbi:MAG: helix-turn-helix transcriptional regulator [Oscillospiraceae bacterium]|jgi:putative molybdopterin biosynthesis protein|nr:helix-turn-helix transcriptional regulator [Oscillospiraceae bacterium]
MPTDLLSAAEVAEELHIKKYTVYEMVKRGEIPASHVGKQVRVSRADLEAYLASRKTGAVRTVTEPSDYVAERPPRQDASSDPVRGVIIAGQDVCLDILINKVSELRGGGQALLRSYMGSYNGLNAMYRGKVTASASHLWSAETDTYNYTYIRHLLPGIPAGAIRLAGRKQGCYVKKGNPLGITGWEDLRRADVTMINREMGSGTRILLDQKMCILGIDAATVNGYNNVNSSHIAVASAVVNGVADVGFGCESVAGNMAGIEFIPLQLEWYDFVYKLVDTKLPVMRALIDYATSDEFKRDLSTIGNYDLSQTGIQKTF